MPRIPKTKRSVNIQLRPPTRKPTVSFETLLGSLTAASLAFCDPRTGANKRYSITDLVNGTFGAFFSQCASFLEHQKSLQQRHGLSNAQTMFGIENIPSDTHIRTLLDQLPASGFASVFSDCLSLLKQAGQLEAYRVKLGQDTTTLLCALDGVEYFYSSTIHCKSCTVKTHKNSSPTYSHTMVTPTLVAPDNNVVVSMMPEFITPQDGSIKQDCEINASKRWLGQPTIPALRGEDLTILGDDLYAHEPFIKEVLAAGDHFIFVCKPDSHKRLYKAADEPGTTRQIVTVTQTDTGCITRTYDYAEALPIRAGPDALYVNFVEMTEVTTRTTMRGKLISPIAEQTYHNAFITDHDLKPDTAPLVALAGRTRWKIENENNNTLKTKGYHLEHNYGHGKEHLSLVLATMNILAFLFHTVLELNNPQYQYVRTMLGSRKTFFENFRNCLNFNCYRSFERLMRWMARGLYKPYQRINLAVPL